jgi:ribose-phosphate pyrophosphokinase
MAEPNSRPDGLMLFAGNANLRLAQSIAHTLNVPLGRAHVGRFSDGEVSVEILEHVRGQRVFVIQPTCAPSADNLMELVVMIDALKRASAAKTADRAMHVCQSLPKSRRK